ncbi:MAG TPA: hypothetical protein PK821_08380, partial [Victivallales bacterium]|nr:hypothetical protein [Victivallales bacterium]
MKNENLKTPVALLFTAFLIFISSAGEADVSGNPAEAVPVFSVGEFNGKTGKAGDELEKSEFSVLSAEGNTVQVKKREDFPQNLQVGQRLAIFLENLDRKADFELVFSAVIEKGIDYNSIPAVEFLYNGNVLYREKLSPGAKQKRLFIPHIWNEEGLNVLEIRNLGLSNIAFDALAIKLYRLEKNSADTGEKPSAELPARIKGFASSAKRTSEYGGILRDKSARFLPDKIIKYIDESGTFFPFEKFAMLKDFYDPYTGKPILAYHVLNAVAPLFEGRPEKIICDIVPATDSEVFEGSVCVAVRNNESNVTVAVAVTPMDTGKYVEVIVPVPWSGETEVEVISGLLPEDDKHASQWLSSRAAKKDKTTIYDGVFRDKYSVKDLIVIRLLQSDKKFLETVKLPAKSPEWVQPVFDRSYMKISASRPAPTCFRTVLLDTKKAGTPVCVSENYKVEVIPATKGDIDRIKDVVPWDSKSLKLEISYPDGNLKDEEWAKVCFQKPSEKCGEISFWVYPRSNNPKIQRVTLMLYFEKQDSNGYSFLATNLKIGAWQR